MIARWFSKRFKRVTQKPFSKILVLGAINFEKEAKNWVSVYWKPYKGQTQGDRDLKYGLK